MPRAPLSIRSLTFGGLIASVLTGCGSPEQATVAPTPVVVPNGANFGFGASALPAPPVSSNLVDYCADINNHHILGDAKYRRAAAALSQLTGMSGGQSDATTVKRTIELRFELAQQLLSLGQVDQVIPELDRSLALAKEAGVSDKAVAPIRFFRAVANLRIADYENCNNQDYPYVCLLFVGPDGAYRKQDHVKAAADDLTAVLAEESDNLQALWLLNVTHMLLGDWPAGVPKAYLIPEERFKSTHAAPRFTNVARDLGVDGLHLLGGSMIEDLDGDGNLDIFTTTYDPCKAVTYYHNDGQGKFENWTERAGLSGITGGFNVAQTDYNNDGRPDIFITRGGWQQESGRMRPSLLRNNPDGTFTDVAIEAGFADAVYPTQISAWADYDNDGDLDVYVGNESTRDNRVYPSQLYRNEGNGRFTDVAVAAGVTNMLQAKGAVWGDYDNDGDEDLYVSNIGPNRLYRNNGDGMFTDVAPALGVTQPDGRSFVPLFFDYDNDGWLDLFVGAYDTLIANVALDYLGQPFRSHPPRLYRNTGGAFEDVTEQAGLHRAWAPMGANFGDIDNDGYPDFYLATGDPNFATLMPNVMLWNDAGKRFVDVTESSATGHLPKGHGVAFGDLDNDGDQDIYLQAGGFLPGDVSPNALFENPGAGNHWLTVKLIGGAKSRSAIGARIEAVIEENGRERSVHSVVNGGGSFGANSLQQELGLGRASRVKRLVITWPPRGTRQVVENIPMDTAIIVHEGDPAVKPMGLNKLQLYHVPGIRPADN